MFIISTVDLNGDSFTLLLSVLCQLGLVMGTTTTNPTRKEGGRSVWQSGRTVGSAPLY
jgi:hypothetical protein